MSKARLLVCLLLLFLTCSEVIFEAVINKQRKTAPALCQCYSSYCPAKGVPSVPVPPSHVQAVPILTAPFPGYQNYHQLRWWETQLRQGFQTGNTEHSTNFSPGNNLSADSTTDLSQSPLKAISSPFQCAFEKAQDGSGATHEIHGRYTWQHPCTGAQWEFHRGLLTEVSTKPSVYNTTYWPPPSWRRMSRAMNIWSWEGHWATRHYLTLVVLYLLVPDNYLKL